jgi:hypothetical protein
MNGLCYGNVPQYPQTTYFQSESYQTQPYQASYHHNKVFVPQTVEGTYMPQPQQYLPKQYQS